MEESVCNYDFSLLPPHIMAQVFTNLKLPERLKAAPTCKSWYFASCDPILSRNVCVTIRYNKRLSHLGNLYRPFKKLCLQYVDFDKFKYEDLLEKFGQQIQEVDFHYCKISLEQLIDCLGYFTNLLAIQLSFRELFAKMPCTNCYEPYEETKAMELLSRNLLLVKHFRIETVSNNMDGLRLIMLRMLNLETIKYTDCTNLPFNFEPLIDYIKQFDDLKLRHLEIGNKVGANFFHSFSGIKTKVNLHTLKIQRIIDANYDRTFEVFCKKLTNLKVLSTTITENQLIDVCRCMANLVELEIFIFTARQFWYITTLQSLKKLVIKSNITYLQDDNDEGLLKLLSVPLTNLQHLEITHRMSLTVLEVLCANYKHLIKLKLSGLLTHNIDAIYKNLVNLKSLKLFFDRRSTLVLTIELEYDITNLTLLEELDMNNCVPGATLDLIKQLPNLKPASVEALVMKLNKAYVSPYDEGTFRMVQNLFE